ncbi:MAG: hypothetical protein M3M85_03200 [bacterium]|nr:hypothetical protein [bacterium]
MIKKKSKLDDLTRDDEPDHTPTNDLSEGCGEEATKKNCRFGFVTCAGGNPCHCSGHTVA